MHKLSPPWEGPFVVSKNLYNGSYYLSMFESAKTHVNWRRRPTGRGILLIFGPTILELQALLMYIL